MPCTLKPWVRHRNIETLKHRNTDHNCPTPATNLTVHHLPPPFFSCLDRPEIKQLTAHAIDIEKKYKDEIEAIHSKHQLLMSVQIDEAASTARREEETRTHEMVENLHQRMNDNNAQLQTLTTSTRDAENDKNQACMEKERALQQLIDAKSEIEENQRAVLETLKLSSEIQASEQELKMALDQEKELHNRTKSDQETLAARLLRTENDCQRLQHQYDTVNQEYASCNDKYNIAQSKERTLSLDVDILNRKNNALTIDYERALKNMKDMHEELLMTKNDKRKHSDRVDTLARSCKEITLDLEREQNAHRKLQEEFQQVRTFFGRVLLV